jgi:hypothetical protein
LEYSNLIVKLWLDALLQHVFSLFIECKVIWNIQILINNCEICFVTEKSFCNNIINGLMHYCSMFSVSLFLIMCDACAWLEDEKILVLARSVTFLHPLCSGWTQLVCSCWKNISA